jgi:putative ABC transport system ATP-binding protein
MENANAGPAVRAAGLAFAYPNGHTLFTDINLDVAAGTLLCITGRSGAGKSTLLYCLAGVLKAEGEVSLMGEHLRESASMRASVRLTMCGFVFQRGELLPELFIVENVELPLRLIGHSRRDAHNAAMEALEQLGVAECANRTPSEVSGGQAQRASVTRALIHQPRIVFADEPTASLDSENRDEVIRHLKETMNHGTTVICATHDPALVSIADDILNLAQR